MGRLQDAVQASVEAATWLRDSDQGAVRLAQEYAAQIDDAISGGDAGEATKTLYLGPHLLNTLRALGCAPAERLSLPGSNQTTSVTDELKRQRRKRASSG